MRELCNEADIVSCDLLERPLAAVAEVSGQPATMRPGMQPPLDEHYFRRIAAIEYAVKADDGLSRALPNADIVLVGVSRTSKTPLSMYLGYLGWKVANVPIVNGIDPPPELFEVDPAKVVGLTIDAQRLAEIRAERIQLMGGDRRYASLPEIYDELEYAAGIHRRLGCPVIDVSELSIEEIAQRILRTVQRRSVGAAAT
jgi:regulator of PEP synthase PpsR (kinase-PPPase family)